MRVCPNYSGPSDSFGEFYFCEVAAAQNTFLGAGLGIKI